MSENTLVEGCIREDITFQKELYLKYYNKMFTLCYRYLNDEHEANIVVHDAFLKVYQKIHQFKPETKLEYWIKRIVINTIIDHLRRQSQLKKRFITTKEFNQYGNITEDNEIAEENWWPKALLIPQETLYNLIKELPDATRIVFNLHTIDELTHKEIADKLKISEGTSKWHLNNARKILREKIINIIKQPNSQEYGKQTKKY